VFNDNAAVLVLLPVLLLPLCVFVCDFDFSRLGCLLLVAFLLLTLGEDPLLEGCDGGVCLNLFNCCDD